MRLPDFLVIGAQKSGTTSLFVLLSKNPKLFLPARKELQFFSSDTLFERGIEWYSTEFFAACPENSMAGEVSPQYMYSTRIARRVHAALPDAKLIAVLRDPIERAYSQYLMSARREQDLRPVETAFVEASKVDENDLITPEALRYFQFSDYATVLEEYLRLYSRDKFLILFQEDLDQRPQEVLQEIARFLGIEPATSETGTSEVRVHQAGDVRFKTLDKILKSRLRSTVKYLVPRKLRSSLVFWLEIKNIRPVQKVPLPANVRKAYEPFRRRQIVFLKEHFGIIPPWPEADEISTT